jgi:hypothetical protein
MQNVGALRLPPHVDLRYIARSANLEPRIRLTVFRDTGCVMLDIRLSVIAKISQPASESREDVLHAFRASVPALLQELNAVIARAPDGGVVFITAADIRSRFGMAA